MDEIFHIIGEIESQNVIDNCTNWWTVVRSSHLSDIVFRLSKHMCCIIDLKKPCNFDDSYNKSDNFSLQSIQFIIFLC